MNTPAMTPEQVEAARAEIVADFQARAAQLQAMAEEPTPSSVQRVRYVVQTSPGLYLQPAQDGVHRVGGIAKAEVFSSPAGQTLAREMRESGQEGCTPVVMLRSGALKHEAAELRRLAAMILDAAPKAAA